MEFSFRTRKQWLEELAQSNQEFDANVVGGGITGAGVLRELMLRGKRAILLEQGDFASGTSSKSSKLVHGGLRYLEMFDFHLVFEALSERHWLLSSHPHLVHPLEFNLPIYDAASAPPGARSSTLLGAGLWLYDALSLFRTPFFHGKHPASEVVSLFPGIREQGLRGSYYYADAMMLDDELVLETLADAVSRGGIALNYTRVEKVQEGFSVDFVDVASGSAGQRLRVRAKEVISCVGPWTALFGERVPGGAERKLKPSKGVHLVFSKQDLPVERCLVMYAPDGRIVFAIPRTDFGSGAEVVIVGTTDSPDQHDPALSVPAPADAEYLLAVLREYFPKKTFSKESVLMAYSGVRPLLDDGEASEAKTSREHEIWRNSKGIVFMAGGKYTTFRQISEEIVDFVFGSSSGDLGTDSSRAPLSTPDEFLKRFAGAPLWGKYTEGWVRWKIRHHAALSLEDVVFRRIPIWMLGRKQIAPYLARIAALCAEEFGWGPEKVREEVLRVERALTIQI